MMAKQLFITGTDTDCGKTYISRGIIESLVTQKFTVKGLKPIASGAKKNKNKLMNDDAQQLMSASNVKVPYAMVNPYCYPEPIAPHIAAALNQSALSVSTVAQAIEKTNQTYPTDYTIIEGAGGWYVPLNDNERFSDLAVALQADVILVVGMKLGCINHALLSAEAIRQAPVNFVGWIANCLDDEMLNLAENLATLQNEIQAPCLEVVAYGGHVKNGF